ncbi:MAG: pantoate--beta-alanine ligase [Bacteroidetes bacterium]|nr:pantoate--beta-alanine ligase [Bacteroidota bacterium]MCL2303060.1 pantoate--beta-alanine ligase [Lentimicrobiaceae bacterium]
MKKTFYFASCLKNRIMILIETIEKLKEVLFRIKSNGKTIGLIPTMGALHEGHISLIKKAKGENQVVVVSIFVNPLQFNNPDDLEKYPRDLEKDLLLIEGITDIVFAPSEKEVFPIVPEETYNFGELDKIMEGASRPGHFNGVATIVKRLFDHVQPDKAYFGEKDFQQLAIIRELVKQCKMDTTIVSCPVVRESNGLAMSSRNQLLSFAKRNIAAKIFNIINKAKESAAPNVKKINDLVISEIKKLEPVTLDYFAVVNDATLKPVASLDDAKGVVACVAYTIGDVRLIDMIRFK